MVSILKLLWHSPSTIRIPLKVLIASVVIGIIAAIIAVAVILSRYTDGKTIKTVKKSFRFRLKTFTFNISP